MQVFNWLNAANDPTTLFDLKSLLIPLQTVEAEVSWGVQGLVLVPVLYEDGRMVDTWTPQGSSSCLRVSVTRFRAALDAPYAARQGNGWSPKSTGKASAWPLSCSKIKARYSTKELVVFFFVCSAPVQLPSPTGPDKMSPKVLSLLPVF